MKKIPEDIQQLLKAVVEDCDNEDRAVRERQIRTWRRLKLFWEGFSRVWYSEVAHDWRVWDEQQSENTDQSAYDKPINVFRAYLESIIAALSVTVPPIKCYPDDAENPLDLITAKAGDKLSLLVYRHNDIQLLWLHSLFVYCTEGMVAAYHRPVEDEKFGTYNEEKHEDVTENHQISTCPQCGMTLNDQVSGQTEKLAKEELDEFDPDNNDVDIKNELGNGNIECPNCMSQVIPHVQEEKFVVTRLVGVTSKPKSRICLDSYGGLNVKVPNYARKQPECPYLIYSYEKDYSLAMQEVIDITDDIELARRVTAGNNPGSYDLYEQWGRLSPQYQGEYPINVITEKHAWIRPAKFNILKDDEDVNRLKKKYPNGVHVMLMNDKIVCAENQCLDDVWTLTYNPLADFLHHDPLGLLLTSIQEITNDLTSLILQTIEHGVAVTFADPGVLNFTAYEQTEVVPGGVFPANSKTGKSLADGFYEAKTATLSQEVMPFAESIQSMAQLVSGALPSLFGGNLGADSSHTASQYSMSRAQALQRLQNNWKMFTIWWKTIFGKVIPMAIKEIKEDEKDVQRNNDGNFINVFIRKSELEGKIGKVELEANENLPMTWSQQKDIWMSLLQNANPEIVALVTAPENLQILREAIGLDELYVPNEDSVTKQYDEIKLLLNSEPIQDPMSGQEMPSIEIDPNFDKNQVEFEICQKWANSEDGRQAKTDNPPGYKNVLLHGMMHKQATIPPPQPPPPVTPSVSYSFKGPDLIDPQIRQILDKAEQLTMVPDNTNQADGNGAPPPEKPTQPNLQEAPITGEANVQVQ